MITDIVVSFDTKEKGDEVQKILMDSGCKWTARNKYIELSNSKIHVHANGNMTYSGYHYEGNIRITTKLTYDEFMDKYGNTTQRLYKALKCLP